MRGTTVKIRVNIVCTVTMIWAGRQRNRGSYLGRCKGIVSFPKQTDRLCGLQNILFSRCHGHFPRV